MPTSLVLHFTKKQLLVTLAENDVFTSVCEFGTAQEIAKYVQHRNAERSEQSPTFYAYERVR